ncbi:UNVERIFIED_CONTAM: hypothetical protein GTU68_039339 [Idotea baltica]|nr:hypothetical protein [Idotea baltica]
MQSRRTFVKLSALGIPVLSSIKAGITSKKTKKPVVVSTWDSGRPVNDVAWEILRNASGSALDAVEAGARSIEAEISCCVGLGGNPDRDGIVTLDACIMDHKFNCGSVAALERIKHPISVARKVMENSPHVMLAGAGAQQFALEQGFPLESGELSETAARVYKEWLIKAEYKPVINIEQTQTMGTVAIDNQGDLSAACTTSGMGFKMRGRVGDSPIIGSGLYVDGEVGAVTGSGQGEEVIRVSGAHLITEFMRQGKSPKKACKMAVERIYKINPAKAKEFQVGFIALNDCGEFGAFSLQPGFSYAVKLEDGEGEVFMADSYM